MRGCLKLTDLKVGSVKVNANEFEREGQILERVFFECPPPSACDLSRCLMSEREVRVRGRELDLFSAHSEIIDINGKIYHFLVSQYYL